jgi:hypothetical protein
MMAKGCGCGMGRVSKPRKKAVACQYVVGATSHRTLKAALRAARAASKKPSKHRRGRSADVKRRCPGEGVSRVTHRCRAGVCAKRR